MSLLEEGVSFEVFYLSEVFHLSEVVLSERAASFERGVQ